MPSVLSAPSASSSWSLSQKTWTFHIVTLGCKVNQYESQAVREAWCRQGGTEVSTPTEADVSLVNSCAVTARGESEGRQTLYRLQRANPSALRVLTGCAACLVAKSVSVAANNEAHEYFHVCVPPRAKAVLLQGPWQWQDKVFPYILPETQTYPPFGREGFCISASQRARPVVKVQDGCSHRCTYCIVPLMRGPSVSRDPTDILAEIQRLLEAGHCEIMLSGINLHQYTYDMPTYVGMDMGKGQNFWYLLHFLDTALAPQWAGKARLRLSSLEPSQFTEEGLYVLGSARMLCPHVHISLQHGSPRILKRMGRGHCRPDALQKAVEHVRRLRPSLGIGADILMGFPGEEDDDVQKTLELIEILGLTYAHVFPYSQRPGTAAINFAGQVPHALILERAARIRTQIQVQKNIFLQKLCAQEFLHVVADTFHTGVAEQQCSRTTDNVDSVPMHDMGKGVDAHYASCRLFVPQGQSLPQGIVTVRPLGVEKEALLVIMAERKGHTEESRNSF